jgi:hypothetical protein
MAFVGLGKWMAENTNYRGCGFDEKKVLGLFVAVIEDPNYFGIIVEKDNEVIGAFFGMAQEYYFSRKKLALDLGFGILPKYRYLARIILPRMTEMFEDWAKSVGVVETVIATSSMAHGDKLESLLNSLDYQTVGFTTKKRI